MHSRLTEPALRGLRSDALSDLLDASLAARVLVRAFVAVTWMVVAVADGADRLWIWGLPLAAAAVVAGLDDRTNLGIGSGLYRPEGYRLLDGSRVAEAIGIVVAAAATGSLVDGFAHAESAVVASLALLVSLAVLVSNTATEAELRRLVDPSASASIGTWTSTIGAALVVGLLLPDHSSAAADIALVAGALLALGAAAHAATSIRRTAAEVDIAISQAYQLAIQDLSLGLHNDLKGPARATMDAIADESAALRGLQASFADIPAEHADAVRTWRSADDFTRQITLELATRVSEFVEVTQAGRARRTRTAADVVHATLRLRDRRAQSRHRGAVVGQLDPETLSELDNSLVSLSLVELVNNAVSAGVHHLEVLVTTEEDDERRRWIRVAVTCDCGHDLAEGRPVDGTLGVLADRLALRNGSLDITVTAPGVHVSTALWPTDSHPDDLPVTTGTRRFRLRTKGER